MAGDWIKMRGNLWDDPRVSRIVDMTDSSEAAVVGALYWLWSTADQHTENGILPGLTLRAMDRKTGVQGFGEALVAIGWLTDHPEGVRILNFEEHNGESAKKRCQTAKRVAKFKSGNAEVTQPALANEHKRVSTALPREEKRREEKNSEAIASSSGSPKARPTKKCPESFAPPEPRAWIAEHCPGVDWRAETEKFRDYTFKNAITDWLGAWRNWMRRAAENVRARASPTEGNYARSMREKYEQVAPAIAAKAPGAMPRQNPMEVLDGLTRIAG